VGSSALFFIVINSGGLAFGSHAFR